MLITASILLVLIGFVHSILGERYILIRLFKRDNIPHLLGSDWFTKQTLRFAWHITTLAWWGFAAILYFTSMASQSSKQQLLSDDILLSISSVFLLSGLASLAFSKGKHLSWIVFILISILCLLSSRYGF